MCPSRAGDRPPRPDGAAPAAPSHAPKPQPGAAPSSHSISPTPPIQPPPARARAEPVGVPRAEGARPLPSATRGLGSPARGAPGRPAGRSGSARPARPAGPAGSASPPIAGPRSRLPRRAARRAGTPSATSRQPRDRQPLRRPGPAGPPPWRASRAATRPRPRGAGRRGEDESPRELPARPAGPGCRTPTASPSPISGQPPHQRKEENDHGEEQDQVGDVKRQRRLLARVSDEPEVELAAHRAVEVAERIGRRERREQGARPHLVEEQIVVGEERRAEDREVEPDGGEEDQGEGRDGPAERRRALAPGRGPLPPRERHVPLQ